MDIVSSNNELDFADILEGIDEIKRVGDPLQYQMQLQGFAMDLRLHRELALEMLRSYENSLEISDDQPPLIDLDDPDSASLFDVEPSVGSLTKKDIMEYRQINSNQRTLAIVRRVRHLIENPLN